MFAKAKKFLVPAAGLAVAGVATVLGTSGAEAAEAGRFVIGASRFSRF